MLLKLPLLVITVTSTTDPEAVQVLAIAPEKTVNGINNKNILKI